MNYIGLSAYDTANGPGVRVSLFVSGCTLRCKGCFNKESWSFTAGRPFTAETEAQIMKALDSKWIAGFSGVYVDSFGYAQFFVSTALLGLPVLVLVWLASRVHAKHSAPAAAA